MLVVVPDAEFWIKATDSHEVFQWREKRLITLACSDDIAEQCITQEEGKFRRPAVQRIAKYFDHWLVPGRVVVSELLRVANSASHKLFSTIDTQFEYKKYRDDISALLNRLEEHDFKNGRAVRETRKQETIALHQQFTEENWCNLWDLTDSSPEKRAILDNTPVALTKACIDPANPMAGLHLNIILHAFNCELEREQCRMLVSVLPIFPGWRAFYAHIMYNIFRAIKSREKRVAVDGSFTEDAKLLMPIQPAEEMLFLTEDKNLLCTQRDIFPEGPQVMIPLAELASKHDPEVRGG